MFFRSAATLYANYTTPLAITSGRDASLVNYKNGSNDSYFAGIGTTKEFEISTDTNTADKSRFRLSTDCTLTKGDGTAWEPKSDDSLVTKGWVTTNGASGNLPISSTDGTVVLDSFAQKSFSIQVGDQDNLSSQLIVDSASVRIKQGSANTLVLTAIPEEPNSWLRFIGSDATGFFGYEQATEKFRILDDSNTKSSFEFETNTGNLYVAGQVQTDKITSKDAADNDASISLGAEVEVRTDGRFIVAPQTRGPTLTDAVITVGSWNNNLGARLEFGWPNANGSDYFARAAIRKDSTGSDLVYAHYSLTDSETQQNGHKFYSNINGREGIGNLLLELRETGTTISTGGQERVTVRGDGMIGVGYAGQSNIGLCLYQEFNTGTIGTQWGFVAAPKFDDQATTYCVAIESQPQLTGIVADVVHFRALDTRSGNESFDGTQYGVFVDDLLLSNTRNIGVASRMFTADGKDNYSFFASGSAPSYFQSEIRVPKLVGLAHSTDASIVLGSELLTSNHTPTQPNSIATRQFVLDQAGAAGLVPFGSPSDDTTPDSPNGSTLHDDLYLYVKGSASWKKTALYPLDSSGGGSEFPLPQPGEDSGIAWETESVNLAFSQPGYGECGAAVGVAGNAFFAGNAWSVDGSQWFGVAWNGTTSGSYGVCDATSRTPAYGNGLYTGRYGYSYDGQSWTTYPNGPVGDETRECFFFQNKHYSMGGSRLFDGQLKANTNPNIAGNIKNSAFVVPSNEGPSQTCLAINYSPPSGTTSLTLTDEAKRNVLLKFSGDMSTTGTWSQLQVEGSSIQTCYGLAHNDLDDKYCFITNNTSYVQKAAGNFTSSGWTKTTLPTTGEWAGLVHDGTHYVAVGIASGANISIYSEDGIVWSQSTTLSNPGVNTIAGFNGRVLAAGNLTSSDLAQILVTGNPTATFTTKNIPLDHPVDVADSYMAQQYQMKETQADANELFTEEIQRRSPVLTLTQAEYDAIPADQIADDTLYLITS